LIIVPKQNASDSSCDPKLNISISADISKPCPYNFHCPSCQRLISAFFYKHIIYNTAILSPFLHARHVTLRNSQSSISTHFRRSTLPIPGPPATHFSQCSST
jgi:hypothetical protein